MADKAVALDKKVPEFALPATGGTAWKLSGAHGRNLVVYFYPRDNTTGCTQEGIDFRDLYPQFKKARTEIVGVSTDAVASHEKFKAKYEFPFELLADEAQKACKLFDVIHEKSMYGRKFMGVVRYDREGKLQRDYSVNERGNQHGRSREFAPGGQVLRDSTYENGSQVGLSRSFHANGQLQRITFYALRESGGGAVAVEDEALSALALEHSKVEGIDLSPEGGASLAALVHLLRSGAVQREERVVAFNTGAGWLYRATM